MCTGTNARPRRDGVDVSLRPSSGSTLVDVNLDCPYPNAARAAGRVVTGLQGQPLHTGVGGLVAADDEHTHATLIAIIDQQFTDA
jgi:hypothetical protein